MSNVIQLLAPNDYRNFKCWVTDVDSVNPVFVSSFKHPAERKPIDMYAKIYSLRGTDRSIFNEILGYLMAHALGLPQPRYACIALVPTVKLRQDIVDGVLSSNLNDEVFQYDVFPVFCTSKIDKSKTPFQYNDLGEGEGKAKAVALELAKWTDMGKAVAVDNTIANIDRHLENLVRTGVNKYHLIDNGILVNGNGWQSSDLQPNESFTNRLLKFSEEVMTPAQTAKIRGNAITACDDHADALNKISDELRYWISNLYTHTQSDYNNFMDFIDYRVNNAHGLLTSRLQLVI